MFGTLGVHLCLSENTELEDFSFITNNKESETFVIKGKKAEEFAPFEVENPRRLVLDLPKSTGKPKKEKYIPTSSECSKKLGLEFILINLE